jgi:hypothetical protein
MVSIAVPEVATPEGTATVIADTTSQRGLVAITRSTWATHASPTLPS